jgi:hypothetical protein
LDRAQRARPKRKSVTHGGRSSGPKSEDPKKNKLSVFEKSAVSYVLGSCLPEEATALRADFESMSVREQLSYSVNMRSANLHFRNPKAVWFKDWRLQWRKCTSILPRGTAYKIGDTREGLQFIDSIYWSLILAQDLVSYMLINGVPCSNRTRSLIFRLLRVSRVDGTPDKLIKSVWRQCAYFLRKTTHRGPRKAHRASRSLVGDSRVPIGRSPLEQIELTTQSIGHQD